MSENTPAQPSIPAADEAARGIWIGSASRPLPVAVRAVVDPLVQGLGFELIGIEMTREGHRLVTWVYIDGPEGITVDHCASVSRELSAALDVEDPIPQAYELRVSSPGLDRPLMKGTHFIDHVGETAVILLSEPLEGRRKFTGTLEGLEEGEVKMTMEEGLVALPMDLIHRAHLKYVFEGPTPKRKL